MFEATEQRAEPFGHLFRARRGDPCRGAPVERALECDDVHPLGRAFIIPVFAHHFDRQFAAFRARIGEKHGIRECASTNMICQASAVAECGRGWTRAKAPRLAP